MRHTDPATDPSTDDASRRLAVLGQFQRAVIPGLASGPLRSALRVALLSLMIQAAGFGTAAPSPGDAAPSEPPNLWPPSSPPGPAAIPVSQKGLLARFCPSTPDGNELVVVELLAAAYSVEIADGEGSLVAEGRFGPGERLLFAANLTTAGRWVAVPARAWDYDSALADGEFQLADDGDEIELRVDRTVADTVVYSRRSIEVQVEGWHGPPVLVAGDAFAPARSGPGGSLKDSDSAADWEPLARASPLPPESEEAVATTSVYQLPGAGLLPWDGLVENSSSTLAVSAYTLESAHIASRLALAASRGIEVRLLVESSPVGGREEYEDCLLLELELAGAEVRLTGLADGLRYHHAKYAIADSSRVLVSTDNLVPSSYPHNGSCCTRGYAAMVESSGIAAAAIRVFEHDWAAGVPIGRMNRESNCTLPAPPARNPEVVPMGSDNAATSVLISTPEAGTAPWERAAESAESEVLLYASDLYTSGGPSVLEWTNRLLDAMRSSAGRGVAVKVITSASSAETVLRWLREGPALPSFEVGVFAVSNLRLHAKLLVVDRSLAVLGSVNPGFNSFHRNREMSLAIHSEAIGSALAAAFRFDQLGDAGPPIAAISAPANARAGEQVTLSGAGSLDDSSIAAYEWDLDDDDSIDAEGEEIEVTFRKPGIAVVRVTVTDAAGRRDQAGTVIEVLPALAGSQDGVGTTALISAAALGTLMAGALAWLRSGTSARSDRQRAGRSARQGSVLYLGQMFSSLVGRWSGSRRSTPASRPASPISTRSSKADFPRARRSYSRATSALARRSSLTPPASRPRSSSATPRRGAT
jgi:phosphatidylserine/phosphatidylglycerophosphate/cardiolipin synthase-like enzyme